MGKTYTENEILETCKATLKTPEQFYNAACVNYTGKTSDTKIPYTEVIAEFLCKKENFDKYVNGISKLPREKSPYKTDTHNGALNENSNQEEANIAKQMFNFCDKGGSYSKIGKIIDYQTPLKNELSDKAGKIDLLAYDEATNTLRILELKKPCSNETMLRCVLEGYTYLKTVDQKKLRENFNSEKLEIPENASVKASPLVFKGSKPYNEYQKDRPHLKKLMKLLESEPIFVVATAWEVL